MDVARNAEGMYLKDTSALIGLVRMRRSSMRLLHQQVSWTRYVSHFVSHSVANPSGYTSAAHVFHPDVAEPLATIVEA